MSLIQKASSPNDVTEGYSLIKKTSCDACKRRKLRCNRQTPSCDSCERKGSPCVYGKPRLRKVVSAGYAHSLEQRLANMETQIQGVESKLSLKLNDNDFLVLEDLYFEHFHASLPILHKRKYFERVSSMPRHEIMPLRYMVCAMSASQSESYSTMYERIYALARQTMGMLEARHVQSGSLASIIQLQAWILMANFEFKSLLLDQAWLSTGRAVRLAQMLRLHCLDEQHRNAKTHRAPVVSDWTDGEEKRRAFWATFLLDRKLGVALGLPVAIEEKGISTFLPAPDLEYQSSIQIRGLKMQQTNEPANAYLVSPFSAVCVVATLWSRYLDQIAQLTESVVTAAVQEGSWIRNGRLDVLLNVVFTVPEHLLNRSLDHDPLALQVRMLAEAGTINIGFIARQAFAKFGINADTFKDPIYVKRLRDAAASIIHSWKLACEIDERKYPFLIGYCIHTAACVLASPLTARGDKQWELELESLIIGLIRLRRTQPLAQSFLNDLRDDFPAIARKMERLEKNYSQKTDDDHPPSPCSLPTGPGSEMIQFGCQALSQAHPDAFDSFNLNQFSDVQNITDTGYGADNFVMPTDLGSMLSEEDMMAIYGLDPFPFAPGNIAS